MITFENPITELIEAVTEEYKERCTCEVYFSDLLDGSLGQTQFPGEGEEGFPPVVLIKHDLNISQILDILSHELAHVIAGEEAEHNEEWQSIYDNINVIYHKKMKIEIE